MSLSVHVSVILTISFFLATACTTDRPGPLPVAVSNSSILSVEDLIRARCSGGADIVISSLTNINLAKEPDVVEGDDASLVKKTLPKLTGTHEVFASHEFVSCKKGRKIRFTSLIYEMEAMRRFSKGTTTPLELLQFDQMTRVKRIMTNDYGTGIEVTAEPTSSTAHVRIILTPRTRDPGKAAGIPMDSDKRTFSLIGRFNHDRSEIPCADTYLTRLASVEAVDSDGKSLTIATIRDDAFPLHISCDHD